MPGLLCVEMMKKRPPQGGLSVLLVRVLRTQGASVNARTHMAPSPTG